MKYPSPPLLCRPQYMYVHVGGPGDTAVAHERACEPFQSVPTAWRWRCHPSPSRRCQERNVTLDPVRVHLPHQAMHHRTTLRSNRRERHASFAPLTPRWERELCNDRACIAGCLGRTCVRIHPKDCAKRPHLFSSPYGGPGFVFLAATVDHFRNAIKRLVAVFVPAPFVVDSGLTAVHVSKSNPIEEMAPCRTHPIPLTQMQCTNLCHQGLVFSCRLGHERPGFASVNAQSRFRIKKNVENGFGVD
eukprot:COSAG06_NODE_7351_length_2534_cov_17.988501_3_plen_246_part_00